MTESPQLEGTSSLALLLAYAPQSSRAALDFSTLDTLTFSTLAEACTQILAQKDQDADLRLQLSGRLRELERKIERTESEKLDMVDQVDSCKRNEEIAKSQASLMRSQLNASESVKRQLQADLGRARRENQALKATTRQIKVVNDRSLARQRERFADAAILAARNGSSRFVVVPGVFSCQGTSSSKDSSTSLYRQQIAEMETQRSSTLASNSALRRLCTESINALNEATAALSEKGPPRALQSDLFPPGRPLRKDYSLIAQSSGHPAVNALAKAINANERALLKSEEERRMLKEKATASQRETITTEDPPLNGSVGVRPKAARIPLRSASSSTKPSICFGTDDAQEKLVSDLQSLQTRLLEREADLKKMEERLEERDQEVEEYRQRAEVAERKEADAVHLAREEFAKLAAEAQETEGLKEREVITDSLGDAFQATAGEKRVEGEVDADRTASSERSHILEPLVAKSSARRLKSYVHVDNDIAQPQPTSGFKRPRNDTDFDAEDDQSGEDDKAQTRGSELLIARSKSPELPKPRDFVDDAPEPEVQHSSARRPRKSESETEPSESKRPRFDQDVRSVLSSRKLPNARTVSSSTSSTTAQPQGSSFHSNNHHHHPMSSTPAAGGKVPARRKRTANPSVLQAALERRRRAAAGNEAK